MSRSFHDYFREVAEVLAEIQGQHAALEARVERMMRKGKVTDVDASKQMYRQEIGLDDNGQPVKSPWVPYAQFAGARKIHTPPTIGQQFMLFSPDGDHEQAHGVPLTFCNANPSPSQSADEHVDQLGKTKNTIKDGEWKQEAGSAFIDLTDGKCVINANSIVLVGQIALGAEGASRELALKGSIDSAGDVEQDNLSTNVKAI